MTNLLTSIVKPDVLDENKVTIHSFIRQSYNQAKKQFKDGVSLFKEEFSSMYDKADHYFDRMMLPVNNFLKDIKQIDSELLQEISKESTEVVFLDGKMVPAEHVLAIPMEENY